ncbi:MAG TPA: iron-containing alcohol dehydrogenase, partial [Candidatus Acidoferrum sp.]
MKLTETGPIRVRSSLGDYVVVCRAGLLQRLGSEIAGLGTISSAHLLTSPKIWKALGKLALRGFSKESRPQVHLLDDAEPAKTLGTVEKAARALVRAGADRQSLVIALGGGVIGDVAGFVAASYLRGVALV